MNSLFCCILCAYFISFFLSTLLTMAPKVNSWLWVQYFTKKPEQMDGVFGWPNPKDKNVSYTNIWPNSKAFRLWNTAVFIVTNTISISLDAKFQQGTSGSWTFFFAQAELFWWLQFLHYIVRLHQISVVFGLVGIILTSAVWVWFAAKTQAVSASSSFNIYCWRAFPLNEWETQQSQTHFSALKPPFQQLPVSLNSSGPHASHLLDLWFFLVCLQPHTQWCKAEDRS